MSNIITIAYAAEGATDERFLESIIKRTFEEVAFQCEGLIEVYDPVCIRYSGRSSFVDSVKDISVHAFDIGINVLCIHVDADDVDDTAVMNNKIIPSFKAVNDSVSRGCRNLIPIIPVYMSEAWMLADKNLFKEEIGTEKSDEDLGIVRDAELIANPKYVLETALRISQSELPKRRGKILLKELYRPIGQKISIRKLEQLTSYRKFKLSVEEAFKQLNYLR